MPHITSSFHLTASSPSDRKTTRETSLLLYSAALEQRIWGFWRYLMYLICTGMGHNFFFLLLKYEFWWTQHPGRTKHATDQYIYIQIILYKRRHWILVSTPLATDPIKTLKMSHFSPESKCSHRKQLRWAGTWQIGIWEDNALPERQLAGIRKRNGLVLKWLGGRVPGERKIMPYRKGWWGSGKWPAHSAKVLHVQMANS